MGRNVKSAMIYLFTAAFAFIFDRVYSIFSHGVFSKDMFSMWIFLVCFGTIFYFILALVCKKMKHQPRRFAMNLYNSGTAIFVTGMLLHGIFEIAGTSSDFILYYKITGILLMTIGVIFTLFFGGGKYPSS